MVETRVDYSAERSGGSMAVHLDVRLADHSVVSMALMMAARTVYPWVDPMVALTVGLLASRSADR